jgi:hypothetical protein
MKKLSRPTKLAIFLAMVLLVITFLPALRFRKLENNNPLPESFSKGVFHVHSTFSDGKGDLAEITIAAGELDFVVLTDHGSPNRDSANATQWVNGVLVVGGSELVSHSAHLAAAGLSPPTFYRYPPEPQKLIDEVNRSRGISFIAHPFYWGNPWIDWSVEGQTGVELINAHTAASLPRFSRLFLIPRYFARPDFAVLTTLEYPEPNVTVWEEMNTTGRYSGIFALDAHARMSLGFGNYVHVPRYAEMFRLLNVYVKHHETLGDDAVSAAASLVASIRAGSFFNCIEGIAPANGFDAFFETDTGERVEMGGESTSHSGRLVIHLPFDFETDVVVKRNGETYSEHRNNGESKLTVSITEAGVYRIEVYARSSTFDDLPWIMSNPFFLDTRISREEPPIPVARKALLSRPDFFRVGHDASSDGSLVEAVDSEDLVVGLRYELPENPVTPEYFVALANRKPRNFTAFDGLALRVRSEERAMFWLMFRTKTDGTETWYRHSFAADQEWSTVAIPFTDFGVHFGEIRPPDLEAVASLHISIDARVAFPGASGTLFVKDFGLF